VQINETALKSILLQLLVEPGLPIVHYFNQTLCILYMLEKSCHGWLYLSFKLRVEVDENEIQTCIYALVITDRKLKQGVTLFTAVSGAPASWIPPNGDVNFISRPSQKFLCDNFGLLQILYNSPLFAASAVALKQGWEPIYYHGPHKLWIIAGWPQITTLYPKIQPLSYYEGWRLPIAS